MIFKRRMITLYTIFLKLNRVNWKTFKGLSSLIIFTSLSSFHFHTRHQGKNGINFLNSSALILWRPIWLLISWQQESNAAGSTKVWLNIVYQTNTNTFDNSSVIWSQRWAIQVGLGQAVPPRPHSCHLWQNQPWQRRKRQLTGQNLTASYKSIVCDNYECWGISNFLQRKIQTRCEIF